MYTLITGATTGIGYEFAKILAKTGNSLILVARNKNLLEERKKELQKKYNVNVYTFATDLSIPNNAKELYKEIKNNNLEVNTVINNAGFGKLGYFHNSDLDEQIDMINLNITSLTILTKLYLKEMISKNRGKILNVSSIAAFQPGPLMAVYYASKAYVVSFTEALWEETRNTPITISVLCPGPTITEFQKRAGVDKTVLYKFGAMSAEKVAKFGVKSLINKKIIAIPGISNKLLRIITKFFPKKIVLKVIKQIKNKQ